MDDVARLKELYLPPTDDFVFVDVPEMPFVMIDSEGSPGGEIYRHAVKWLFTAIYPLRRIAKERMGKNFVEAPLEALYWADDMRDFAAGNRDKTKWRVMIVLADWVKGDMFASAVAQAKIELGEAPETLRLERFDEGKCAQIMHVGPNEQETAVLKRLYAEFLPQHNLVPSGHYHEIYLNDPNRVAPAKRRTVLRQPVRSIS